MANWVDVYNEDESFKNSYNGFYETNVKGKVCATLQYDTYTISPTYVKLRFKLICNPLSNYYDEYHVLLNPEDAATRSLHLLKSDYTNPAETSWTTSKAQAKWPYYAETYFELEKKYTDEKFTVPTFWLMNDGWNNTTKETPDAFYNNYKIGGKRGKSFRSVYGETSVEIANNVSVATPGGSPEVYISDNGNNTIKLWGTLGKAGENNNITSATLYYTIDGSDPKDSTTRESFSSSSKDAASNLTNLTASFKAGAAYSKSINIKKSCTIRAYIECEFEYNTTSASSDKTYPI